MDGSSWRAREGADSLPAFFIALAFFRVLEPAALSAPLHVQWDAVRIETPDWDRIEKEARDQSSETNGE